VIDKSEYAHSIARALIYTYTYVFLEWLFFVTKFSFLTIRPWSERIVALLVGVWPFLIAVIVIHMVMCILAWVVGRVGKRPIIGRYMLKLIPALVVTAIVLMLTDNFTYTVFKWGIVKTSEYTVFLYWLLFAGIFVWALQSKSVQTKLKLKPVMAGVLFLLSVMPLVLFVMDDGLAQDVSYNAARSGATLPNIIMFASDGVNANRMSAYGYGRKTTPNLDELLDRALVADNAFTNSGMTTGSLTSMMTGKYPTTTKVFYPPQTLQGTDAYEHLPRILRKLGYKSLQETIGYYADAKDLNWLDSFNYANGRELHWSQIDRLPIKLQAAAQLAESTRVRLQGRTEHLLFIKRMTDNYAGVVPSETISGNVVSDDERMASVFNFIEHTRQPFFIQVHLMGTHCCKWHPKSESFLASDAASKSEQEDASFDDAILQSDRYFGEMMKLLQRDKMLDNTLVIYSSDHVKGWDFRSQIPLIFFFPHGKYKGNIATPTQLLDVAPTVLDYLNVKVPDWMEGKSIINNHLPEYRPIFVGYRARYLDTSALHAEIGPPYYDLASAGLVVCNQWYILSLSDKSVTSGTIPTYRGKCAKDKLPDRDAARTMISEHLHERGFSF